MNGFLRALVHGRSGEAYNIGNPTPEISMDELARITAELCPGRGVEVQKVSYPDSYPGDEPQRRCPDITKARTELGYEPTVVLEQGLKKFYDWAFANYRGTV